MVPVTLPSGVHLHLSPGKHNEVQKAVVEEFAPRFAPGSRLLYLGDTAKKDLVVDSPRLAALGVAITEHDKLPDILLHHEKARERRHRGFRQSWPEIGAKASIFMKCRTSRMANVANGRGFRRGEEPCRRGRESRRRGRARTGAPPVAP